MELVLIPFKYMVECYRMLILKTSLGAFLTYEFNFLNICVAIQIKYFLLNKL